MNQPFRFESFKDDRVTVYFENRAVTHLTGKQAVKFLQSADTANEDDQQLLMARVTGNFKRGNERR